MKEDRFKMRNDRIEHLQLKDLFKLYVDRKKTDTIKKCYRILTYHSVSHPILIKYLSFDTENRIENQIYPNVQNHVNDRIPSLSYRPKT